MILIPVNLVEHLGTVVEEPTSVSFTESSEHEREAAMVGGILEGGTMDRRKSGSIVGLIGGEEGKSQGMRGDDHVCVCRSAMGGGR